MFSGIIHQFVKNMPDTETLPEPKRLSRSAGTMAFGGFLIVTGALILVFARDIDSVDLGNHDPGPRAVPTTLGTLLLAGGFYQLALGWFTRKRSSLDQAAGPDEEPADVLQPHNINVIITVVALIGYLALLETWGSHRDNIFASFSSGGSAAAGGSAILAAILLTAPCNCCSRSPSKSHCPAVNGACRFD